MICYRTGVSLSIPFTMFKSDHRTLAYGTIPTVVWSINGAAVRPCLFPVYLDEPRPEPHPDAHCWPSYPPTHYFRAEHGLPEGTLAFHMTAPGCDPTDLLLDVVRDESP